MTELRHTGPLVDQRQARWATNALYCVLVLAAGYGNVTATWLPWPWPMKTPVVVALELTGVVLAINADARRRAGEKAYAWRIASAVAASVAIGINWFGHQSEPIMAVVFTAFSGIGYVVYLIRSGDAYRDYQRARGQLAPVAPDYGMGQWVRHPWLTHRAAQLARRHGLGLYDSLDAVAEERRRAADDAALTQALADYLTEGVPEARQALALRSYDLPLMVQTMRGAVDNEGAAQELALSLTAKPAATGEKVRRRVTITEHSTPRSPSSPRRAVTTKKTVRTRPQRDPFDLYADRITRVQLAYPDWRTRDITYDEIGACGDGCRGKEAKLTIKRLLKELASHESTPTIVS